MKNTIKKSLIFGITLLALAGITMACDSLASMSATDFQRSYQAGAQVGVGSGAGYVYIGNYSSESDCRSACAAKGYKNSYLWGYDTKMCQCK